MASRFEHDAKCPQIYRGPVMHRSPSSQLAVTRDELGGHEAEGRPRLDVCALPSNVHASDLVKERAVVTVTVTVTVTGTTTGR